MSAQSAKSPEGVALGFNEDHTPLVEMILGNSDEFAAVREAVVNALQGNRSRRKGTGRGATKIDLLPGRAGKSTIIRDNGPGMSPDDIPQCLLKIFSGKKDRRKQENQGAGIKTVGPAHNPDGVVITTWTSREAAFQVTLYLEVDEREGKKLIKYRTGTDGNPIKRVAVPKDATSTSGTQVELMNTPWRPYELMKYLNGRFEHFKTLDAPDGVEVRVHRAAGYNGPTEDRVLGYAACLERIACKGYFGEVRVKGPKNFSFLWAVRDTSPERAKTLERFCSDYFKPMCLGLSFQDEMYESTAAGRAVTVLTSYGIRAGGRDVVLLLRVDGSEVTPNISRTSLGDKVDREELKELVRENLPPQILDYMDKFEAEHFAEHVDTVAETLTRLYATARYLEPASADVIPPASGEGGADTARDEAPERELPKKRRRRRNRSRGYPRTVFVDSAQLGSLLVHYDEVNHVIQINQDHARMKLLLGKIEDCPKSYSRSWLRSEVLGHVAGQASAAFNNLAQDRDDEPNDDDLAAALGVCAGAILFLTNPNKYKLGKKAQDN